MLASLKQVILILSLFIAGHGVTFGVDEPTDLTVALYGPLQVESPDYHLYLTFSGPVSALSDDDFRVVNGRASNTISISDDTHDTHQTPLRGRFYKTTITASKPGPVEVTLPAGAVTAVGGTAANTASNTYITQCTSNFADQWVVDSAEEWVAAMGSNDNLTIAEGAAEPTAAAATFSSVVQTFPTKRKAATITFQQSAVWDNWVDAGNIGPAQGAHNAPIFLPVADGDYYLLSARTVYHSTDMVNWSEGSKFGKSKWTTSAEYMDGKFYITYDKPNDEDPVLIIDEDLMDNQIGNDYGTVFHDPSHGSDNSLFRDDADGLFHIIYEEFSPIDPTSAAHDSPLGGHTSSPDCKTGFLPHEHHPVVDHRTTPTGTFAEDRMGRVYEVHEGSQDAYGDWTTIKIGKRYYLFADFHHHDGGNMSVARFTGDSLYEPFERVGSLGKGHPDPTVGFAEGQFYLITQTKQDFVSPGPWVDGVQARAGVDTDGDGTTDQWTEWQAVHERYDHKPGYARVVDVTPAQIDLSSLPAGIGFQFEFKIDNNVVPKVSPIMDAVTLTFEP